LDNRNLSMWTSFVILSILSSALALPFRPSDAPDCKGVLDCNNHGVCAGTIDSAEGLYCICDPGYFGLRCQLPEDKSAVKTTADVPWCETQINCNGNGVCSGGVEDLQCNCFPGWYGVRCQIPVS
ncbi:hypothetical protein PMAYCL1PPCAC_05717, partial [Pristionchus mayeri]